MLWPHLAVVRQQSRGLSVEMDSKTEDALLEGTLAVFDDVADKRRGCRKQ